MNNRRQLLAQALAATVLGPLASTMRLAVAANPAAPDAPRLVCVILRGGLCGLTAVPAVGDPAFADVRGPLAQFAGEVLPLDGSFALNPLLPSLHAMYGSGELAVLHAVGLPYRERSHFDAQQLLESGGSRPYALNTGWLARAMGAANGSGTAPKAVALQTAVPLLLRGPQAVDSWAPSLLPEPSADLVARLQMLYRNDAALGSALARAKGLRDLPGMAANMARDSDAQGSAVRSAVVDLARKAADFLQHGSQLAVLEMGGWDSHVNQARPQGPTSNNLRTLDALLAALREGLMPQQTWRRTVVLVLTEFGREVAVNGTEGTDHGSGGAALVLGGAVQGGRVITDWPGLAAKDRFEGRDLRITTDLRAALRGILGDHLRISRAALDNLVLPGSAAVKPLQLLKA